MALSTDELDAYGWEFDLVMLAGDIAPVLARLWQLGYGVAGRTVLTADFAVPFHAAAIWAQERAGWLVAEVDGVTRERIRQVLADVLGPTFDNPDVTPLQLADAITAEFEQMSEARAATIARTETAYAAANGAGDAFRTGGIEQVEISDGDYDEACAAADGQIWTLDEYLANPLEHPNCTRAAFPIVPEPEAVDEPLAAMSMPAPTEDPLDAEIRDLLKASIERADRAGPEMAATFERWLQAQPAIEVHVAPSPAPSVTFAEGAIALELPAPALAKRSVRRDVERDERGRITAVLETVEA